VPLNTLKTISILIIMSMINCEKKWRKKIKTIKLTNPIYEKNP